MSTPPIALSPRERWPAGTQAPGLPQRRTAGTCACTSDRLQTSSDLREGDRLVAVLPDLVRVDLHGLHHVAGSLEAVDTTELDPGIRVEGDFSRLSHRATD